MFTNNPFSQFLKFSFVGVINTIITLLAIWVMVHVFLASQYVANITGYVLGVANSYIMNKLWTFNDKSKTATTFVKFIIVFGITYIIQFSVLSLLLNFTAIDAFVCQIIAMVVYTVLNFSINKKFTFKTNS